MTSPYFIQPGQDWGQGLQALAGSVERYGQAKKQEEDQARVQKRFQDAQKAMSDAFASKDPNVIMQAVIDYPEIQKTAELMFGFTNDQSKEAAANTYRQLLADPQNAMQYLDNGIQRVAEVGGKPYNMIQDRIMFENDPEAALKAVKAGYAALDPKGYAAMFPKEGVAGGIGTYNPRDYTTESWDQFIKTADPGVLKRYETSAQERIATNPDLANAVAVTQGQIAGEKAGSAESAKLNAQAELKPDVEKAVTIAKETAKQMVEQSGEQRSNDMALRMYDTAMTALSDALGGTATGPGVGWLPAVTANAQIAEGAVSAMAPILKQLFRTSGEGTFTDKDQELLLNMIPTRKTLPEARDSQIKAIDAIVRAKLNQPSGAPTESKGKYSIGQVIEVNGQKYKVTGGDLNDPDVEPVQ